MNVPGQNIRMYDEPTGTIETVKFLSLGPQQGYITIQVDDANPTMVGIRLLRPLHNSEEVNANQADNSDDDNIDESESWEEPPLEALDPQESASNFQCVMTEQESNTLKRTQRVLKVIFAA